MLKVGELTDLLELVQPSKLFIEHGRKDNLFPIESMRLCAKTDSIMNGMGHMKLMGA
ncbi:hypothetical protein JCM19046_1784 [Bacillus sp. JCM 19046]|nr:hypothetical protein JCM19046_1784 [Bacillus sp. JCM 19046]